MTIKVGTLVRSTRWLMNQRQSNERLYGIVMKEPVKYHNATNVLVKVRWFSERGSFSFPTLLEEFEIVSD